MQTALIFGVSCKYTSYDKLATGATELESLLLALSGLRFYF
jgi:hypothetical protein